MRKRSTQSKPENDSLLNFLCNPLLSILNWIIWLVLYLCSRLGITLYHCFKRQQFPISPAGEQKLGYGTEWEIKQAVQDKNAGWLADIATLYVWGALLLGMFLLLLIQWPTWPVTTPLIVVAIPVFLAWCFGYITQPYYRRMGAFCILTGILGGIAAIRWPQNLSKHHWEWVLIFIAGGIAFLWQAWKKSHEPSPGEQE